MANTSIVAQFREIYLDGDWVVNTNLKSTLEEVSYHQAVTTIGTHNSIAALTFHLDYYMAGILRVFDTGALDIRDKYSFELPDLDTADSWLLLKKSTIKNCELMASKLQVLSEEYLDSDFVDKKYGSWRRNIEALIEHGYYHLGQIVMLTKLIPQEA